MCLHYIRLLPMGEWLFECAASHRIFALRCILLWVRASHQIVASLLFLQYTTSRQIQVREKKRTRKKKKKLFWVLAQVGLVFLVPFFFFFLNSTPNACCGCFYTWQNFGVHIRPYFVVICGSIYWRILTQCGLALHWFLTDNFRSSTIIVSYGLAPHVILLIDSLRSPTVTFNISRRHHFDPTTDFDCI